MKTGLIALVVLVALGGTITAVWFNRQEARNAADDGVVILAYADGIPVSNERFKITYVDYLIRTSKNDTPYNRTVHLDNLIDTYLMGQQGEADGIADEAAFQEYLALERKKSLGGRYYETAFLDTLQRPDEAAVRNAYVKQSEKLVIRHLLFTREDEAWAAYNKLEAGADFVDLANEVYHTPSYDSTAGYLGVATYWQLDDAFAETAFALQPGTYAEPVRTRYGWHIILVEDKVFNPILTESEFQTRKQGVEGNVWLRRVRLAGDQFVKDIMAAANVDVDRATLLALQAAVRDRMDAAGFSSNHPPLVLQSEVEEIKATLRPDALLATFEVNGERQQFLASDYVFWLGTLPAHEAYHRTGASLGRALRNEVLARLGAAANLDSDPIHLEHMQYAQSTYLAERVQAAAINAFDRLPTEAERIHFAERAKLLSVDSTVAHFWAIPFETYQTAENAKRQIINNAAAPAAFENRIVVAGGDYRQTEDLGPYVAKAPLNETVVVGTEKRWYVLHVESRETRKKTLDDIRGPALRTLERQLAVVDLIETLRTRYPVQMDTLQFRKKMLEEGLQL